MNSLLSRLKQDYPGLTFKPDDQFAWSSNDTTVSYAPSTEQAGAYLLHEVAHATLGHSDYQRDIELIQMERDAWEVARHQLADRYDVEISEEFAQDSLDTYRDWLYARSKCPNCSNTGFEKKRQLYTCPACSSTWRVNEARSCALRRYRNT